MQKIASQQVRLVSDLHVIIQSIINTHTASPCAKNLSGPTPPRERDGGVGKIFVLPSGGGFRSQVIIILAQPVYTTVVYTFSNHKYETASSFCSISVHYKI